MERMTVSPSDIQTAIEGAYALVERGIGGEDEACDAIIKAGGHVKLVDAIATFPDNKELCYQASVSLYIMADDVGPRSSAMVAAGAGPLLAAIARTHDKFYESHVEKCAQKALIRMGLRSDGNRKVILNLYLSPTTSFHPTAHHNNEGLGRAPQEG